MTTVLEGMCGDGTVLPPFIIFKAEEFRASWIDDDAPFRKDVLVGHSHNGWTDNTIGIAYLCQYFGP